MQASFALTVSPLLLLLLLGTASTLPLVDSEGDGVQFVALDVDPRVHIIPVIFEVDPYSSLEQEDEDATVESLVEGGLVRRRRQTTVSGDINREDLGRGAHRDSGHVTLTHKNDPHTFAGTLRGERTSIPKLGSSATLGLGGSYSFNPSDDTSLSVSAFHDRELDGRFTQNSGSLGLTHNTGRHSFTGAVEASRLNVPGLGSSNDFGASGSYNYNFDKDTSLSIGGGHNSRDGNRGFFTFRRRF